MMAAITFRRLKAVFAFDNDIDIFDDRQAMWALPRESNGTATSCG